MRMPQIFQCPYRPNTIAIFDVMDVIGETENSDLPEADEAYEEIITNEEVETAGIQNEIATQPGTSRETAL
ncbi:hypothetical protein QE152_g36560 [Popillia japonica]|uniref:Uncharacterized protein n=1 Tax=Popillia japonica TaxID=7064 RepID=A0AAW1ICT2_POPJA